MEENVPDPPFVALTPSSLVQLRGRSRSELVRRTRIELEDGTYVLLHDEHVDQLYRLCNHADRDGVDTAWLVCDSTRVAFVTRTGTRLRVCVASGSHGAWCSGSPTGAPRTFGTPRRVDTPRRRPPDRVASRRRSRFR